MREQYFALRDQSLKELEEIQKRFEEEVISVINLEKTVH